MNKQTFDNPNDTTYLTHRWQNRNWARYGRLMLVSCFLVTTGCAHTAKLKPFASDSSEEINVTVAETEPRPQSESDSSENSPEEKIDLVAYQDELLPTPLLENTPQTLIDDQQSMNSEHLPLPAPHLHPLSPAIGAATQHYQPNPLTPPNTTSPRIVNLRGASFRESPKTATEVMLELKSENDRLRQQIANGKRGYNELVKQFKDQKQINQKLVNKLTNKVDRSQSESAQLRSMVAKLKVQVDRLVVDKTTIQKQSEAALREIESNLDTVLLDSISRARRTRPEAN